MKKNVIVILVIGILVAGVIFFMNGFGDSSKTVAIVDGKKIKTTELEEFKNKIIAQQGIDVTKFDEETKKQFESSILDGMISQKLLDMALEKSDIKVEDSEVEAKFNEIKTQIGSEEQFKSLLTTQNLTEQTLKDQLKDNIKQEKYFAQSIDFSKITVTDEEIKTAFDQASQGQEIGTFEENKENIKNYLMNQKKQELIIKFIEDLRKSAKVEILNS